MAGAGLDSRKLYKTRQCLPLNCYNFTIRDSFGDGNCCDFGKGYFNLTVDGEEILSGGNFKAKKSAAFGGKCVDLPQDPRPALPPCVNVSVTLVTDAFPTETSVRLTDHTTSEKYWDSMEFQDADTVYTLTAECLDRNGCYRFSITDIGGDGICCDYGEGSFELSVDGEVVHSG
jgi:hypothetical protein